MFTLWALVEAGLLCLNAVCILHEQRFLAKFGWGASSAQIQGFGEAPTIKTQVLNLVRAIRTVAKVPLIIINLLAIFFKLLLG
ncbi:immediate early response 3-interacting protein 1 [Uranotaenia lowii]|uniref:immediate early response 3-interacting protein 1 n=1 Tax=Uranotaenia lowii TaxID=190385 RepID=UPI002478975B|nr:immediate early response 3-interacting protein 1 [Uranotaenia lowii]